MQIEPGMLAQAKILGANIAHIAHIAHIAAVARLLAVRGVRSVREAGWARACCDLRLTAGA